MLSRLPALQVNQSFHVVVHHQYFCDGNLMPAALHLNARTDKIDVHANSESA